MPWFIPVLVTGATIGLARKLVQRYRHSQLGLRTVGDPPGIRTVARFTLPTTGIVQRRRIQAVLAAIAESLAPGFEAELEVTKDAVRGKPAGQADVVELVRLKGQANGTCTLELTRAATGTELGELARAWLVHIHHALELTGELANLGWFARQDRAFVEQHAFPHDAYGDGR